MNKYIYIICVFAYLKGYAQSDKEIVFSEKEKTVFQTSSAWKPEIDIRSDVAIIYGAQDHPNLSFVERVKSWREKGYNTHFMTGIAWGEYADYFTGEWDGKTHWDAGQVDINGDTIWHNKGTVPYIVPVESYVSYFKEKIIKKVIDAGISSIYLEEPEFWARSGYSETFKKEWKKFYGFQWRPQHKTPENAFLSNKLKYQLYYNAIDEVSTFAKEYGLSKGINIKIYIPTHSLINYSSWEIVSPEASLASLNNVDGYIAQVWTGTSREPTYFNGKKKERVFENAFLEYGSMESMTSSTGRKMFFLTDPIEDWPRDWADYKLNYQATFTAQLFYPEIANYEVMPWPSRIYTKKYKLANDKEEALIPAYYATQMQVMINALNEMPISNNKLNGSDGIGVLMSNSLMFQRFPFFDKNKHPQFSNFYGQTMPLLKRGVPIELVHMENLSFPKTLEGIKVLVMTYSNMKPKNKEEHRYLANWVKNGGVLIYSSMDDDPFQSVTQWWNEEGMAYKTPFEHLLKELNITYDKNQQKYPVGKGVVHVFRENPKDFVVKKENDEAFIELVKSAYELDAKAGKLEFKNYFHLTRGNFEIAAVLDESINEDPLTLKGMFIDLFDPQIPVIKKKVVKPGEQTLLLNIERIKNKNIPRVLASASRISNEYIEDNTYSFESKAPLFTTNVMRILLPKKAKTIQVTNRIEDKKIAYKYHWDEVSKTAFVTFENNPKGIVVKLDW